MKKYLKVAVVCLSMLLVFGASYAYATGQAVTGGVNMVASFSQPSIGGITSNTLAQTLGINTQYTTGTGSKQVDSIYAATLTLSATATTLDLTNLTDPAGNSVNFARVREFIVVNQATTAGFDVNVLQGAANGWSPFPATGGTPCRYSGILRIADPVSTGANNGNVVSSTSKTVKLDPGANNVTVLILVVGGSAAFVILPFNLRRYRRSLAA